MNDIKYCNNYIVKDDILGLWHYLSSKRQRRFKSGQIKYTTYPNILVLHPDIDIPF
jgi:hypothetical protein